MHIGRSNSLAVAGATAVAVRSGRVGLASAQQHVVAQRLARRDARLARKLVARKAVARTPWLFKLAPVLALALLGLMVLRSFAGGVSAPQQVAARTAAPLVPVIAPVRAAISPARLELVEVSGADVLSVASDGVRLRDGRLLAPSEFAALSPSLRFALTYKRVTQ